MAIEEHYLLETLFQRCLTFRSYGTNGFRYDILFASLDKNNVLHTLISHSYLKLVEYETTLRLLLNLSSDTG